MTAPDRAEGPGPPAVLPFAIGLLIESAVALSEEKRPNDP